MSSSFQSMSLVISAAAKRPVAQTNRGRYARVGAVDSATQTLHRLTSYIPGREWTEPPDDPRAVIFEVNDLERLPWFYKRYAQSLPGRALPRDLPRTTAPALAVLAGTADVAPATLDLPQLARLLHLSA